MVFQQLLETWLHSEKEWERERALQVCTQLMKAYAERFVAAVSIASLLPEPFGSPVGAAGVPRGRKVRADLVSQEALQAFSAVLPSPQCPSATNTAFLLNPVCFPGREMCLERSQA